MDFFVQGDSDHSTLSRRSSLSYSTTIGSAYNLVQEEAQVHCVQHSSPSKLSMYVMIGSLRLLSTLLCFQTAAGLALKKNVVSRRVVTFALSGGAHRIFSSIDNAKNKRVVSVDGEVDERRREPLVGVIKCNPQQTVPLSYQYQKLAERCIQDRRDSNMARKCTKRVLKMTLQ